MFFLITFFDSVLAYLMKQPAVTATHLELPSLAYIITVIIMMVFSPQKSEDLKVGSAPSCPASRLARESKVGWQTQLIYLG
jgi:hypothetical protein